MYKIKNLTEAVQRQLMEAIIDGSRVGALVTDASQKDNPIIFANRTFEEMTGYTREEILGQNCRFLQGEETDPSTVAKIRRVIAEKASLTVVIKNYKKDGTLFWNRLNLRPLNIDGTDYYIGTQTDVSVQYRQIEELHTKEHEIEQLMLPIMMIHDKLAAVSLIGQMTEERFSLLITKLSDFVHSNEVDHVMLDITGLFWNQGTSIDRLIEIQKVLKLMGSQLYITGVTPEMARKLAASKDPQHVMKTFSSIQQAICHIQQ